jgi:hypothetical protein
MLDVEQVNNDLIDSQLITPKKGDSGEESGNEDQQESPDTARIKKSQVVNVNGTQVTSAMDLYESQTPNKSPSKMKK